MEDQDARRQRRLAARSERVERAASGRRKAQQRRRLTIGSLVVLVLALLALGVPAAMQSLARPAPPGRSVPDEGNSHVTQGAPLEFKSVPPSSGSHYPVWARSGVYPESLDPGNWVHSLEHGYIVVLYNCPSGCPDDVEKLRQFYESAPKSVEYTYQKLIIQPYTNMPHKFAAVAWTRIDEMDELNLDELSAFYRAYLDKGPENAP